MANVYTSCTAPTQSNYLSTSLWLITTVVYIPPVKNSKTKACTHVLSHTTLKLVQKMRRPVQSGHISNKGPKSIL